MPVRHVALALLWWTSLGCGQSAAPSLGGAGNAGGGATGNGAAAGAASAGSGAGKAAGGMTASMAGGGESTSGDGGNGGEPTSDELSDCGLAFPYNDEQPRGHWLGADSNFSVVLGAGRALMTFQDTFVGGSVATERNGSAMVGNSVAAIGCQGGRYTIDYAWGGLAQQHAAMFATATTLRSLSPTWRSTYRG